jgi:hypothetical protein
MDAYGNVADGNIGNFLQNMTGVAVTKEAGDIVASGSAARRRNSTRFRSTARGWPAPLLASPRRAIARR